MNKKRFLSICIGFMCSFGTLIMAENNYQFEYSKDKISAVSINGETKEYKRGEVNRKGIDISSWSGDINWAELKSNGVEFVMMREGYGSPDPKQVDRRFRRNIENAQKVGMPVGVYHYSYAISLEEAKKEAEFCIENIKNYKLEYPVSFDIEHDSMKKNGKELNTQICQTFCDKIREAGYYASVYMNKDWLHNYVIKDSVQSKYDLWIAHWHYKTDVWSGMWQKVGDTQIKGVQGNVDLNECYYDYPKIMKELHINGY